MMREVGREPHQMVLEAQETVARARQAVVRTGPPIQREETGTQGVGV